MSKYSYADYQTKMQKIADLRYAAAVLQWDQETYLPKKGQAARGRQLATLEEAAHEAFTDPSLGSILAELALNPSLSEIERRNIALTQEAFDRHRKIPSSLVRQLSEAVQQAFHAWSEAYPTGDFQRFEHPLDQLIQLKRQEADLLGFEGHPYNALMNDYEKGLTVADVDTLFADLIPQLQPIIAVASTKPASTLFHGHFSQDAQWKLGMDLLALIGFDFDAGRQDLSLHPFTTNFSAQDVRLTTRIDESDFGNMLWSCLHEGGHGLYEQGLPDSQYGLPSGEYCSLSIHESQSRMWENNIGRGKPFWQHAFPLVQQAFPDTFGSVSLEQFYAAMNQVRPSLIRTEADELTYHAHIRIRYELEKALLAGTLRTREIPDAWAEGYRSNLGIEVPNHTQGCLQDVHWSHGSFGYFPTYSLGSLYAAQFYAAMRNQVPQVEEDLARGHCAPVLHWLRQHIHQHGKTHAARTLCEQATGESLQAKYFVDYARRKFLGESGQ